jgi:hypothetical protein
MNDLVKTMLPSLDLDTQKHNAGKQTRQTNVGA